VVTETGWQDRVMAEARAAAGSDAHQAAVLAGEAIRALNHLTLDPGSLTAPGEVYEVAGALATCAQRLPQALSQAADQVLRWQLAGELRRDDGGYPGERVERAIGHLESAQLMAADLGHFLGLAQASLADLWRSAEGGEC
jgi:hypothetical protein